MDGSQLTHEFQERRGDPFHALPCSAGFYWWRVSADEDWRMVQIVDFAAGYPEEPPHLAAYDVEKHAWGGRTLRMWEIHDPIGEWVECHKPNTLLSHPHQANTTETK
jgi:hypothetical protein